MWRGSPGDRESLYMRGVVFFFHFFFFLVNVKHYYEDGQFFFVYYKKCTEINNISNELVSKYFTLRINFNICSQGVHEHKSKCFSPNSSFALIVLPRSHEFPIDFWHWNMHPEI